MASSEKVDVVVPVRKAEGKEYDKLLACCSAIRTRVPVNHLIIVTGELVGEERENISELADVPVFSAEASNVGRARRVGLNLVETRFFASIDSDVILSKDWFSSCLASIRDTQVAACQGYLASISKLFDKYIRIESLATGRYADLGNTLLRTDLVKMVGMPSEPYLEDHILQRRLRDKGYLWIVKPSLESRHLLDELDIIAHRFRYGQFDPCGLIVFSKYVAGLLRTTHQRRIKYGLELAIFLLVSDLCYAVGSVTGFYSTRGILKYRSTTRTYQPQ